MKMEDLELWVEAKELVGVANLPLKEDEIQSIASEEYWQTREKDGIIEYNLLRLPKEVIDEIFFDKFNVKFPKSKNSQNSQTWFLSKELVDVGGVTNKIATINARARNDGWIRRKALRGGKNHMFEFHVASLPDVMIAELGFIPAKKDFIIENGEKWYTAKEIAGNDGVPSTPAKVNIFATENNWYRRIKQTGKGKRAYEYCSNSLPKETLSSLKDKGL